MSTQQIHFIEELAANAWPAAIVQVIDGWRLRFNWGVTSRANSVYPNDSHGQIALEDKLRHVEDFYTHWGGLARYQICPAAQPDDLDAILARRGYTSAAHTSVQVAPTATVMARAQTNPISVRNRVCITPSVSTLDDTWAETYCTAGDFSGHKRAMRLGILERIGPRAGFALAHIDGQPAGVGLGVVERGWTGIFCMETLPAFRRQGVATAILKEMALWGQRHGGANMYLQVMQDNTPACALYAKVGFSSLYIYHYREAPQISPGM
ncbi:MAG: GNAT family N-acetyltransferase [Chloroflexi bacterium]|nr:GNAT family N-acetyltransferase [Chloroflexota bacterium]